MAITELLPLRARRQIACFGGLPSGNDLRAFLDRDFLVTPCSERDLHDPAYLSGLAAVVFTQNTNKPLQIVPPLNSAAKLLLNFDCRIVIRLAPNHRQIAVNIIDKLRLPSAGLNPNEEAQLKAWRSIGRGYPLLPHINVLDVAASWNDVARMIEANPPGHAPGQNLKISPENLKLSPRRRLLLQRAFWDCAEVHLEPMDDGNSGVTVYRAYVDLMANHIGAPWPLPYFIKIGNREKIFVEYKNYEDKVDPYVPFHLGPHLIRERCCLGACEGIIVGDYIEESESLKDCARDGRAASAIACLFTRTLRGWYRGARKEQNSLTKSLKFPEFDPATSNSRIDKARRFGSNKTPKELEELFNRCSSLLPVLVGPIHGDLHAANIRVRATDAIVIDFLAHSHMPLIYDAACLEASLLVDGFDEDMGEADKWLESIESLYEHIPLQNTPEHPHPKNESAWFHECVRQVRLYALQMECQKGQYAAALAIALLKKASKDMKVSGSESDRRAAAYALAERVLVKTFDSES